MASFIASFIQCLILCIPFGGSIFKLFICFGVGTVFLLYRLFSPKDLKGLYIISLKAYGIGIFLGGGLLVFQRFLGNRSFSMITVSCLAGGIAVLLPRLHTLYKETEGKGFVKVEVFFDDKKSICLTALIDSGNSLVDPVSKTPVSVVSEDAIREFRDYLFPEKFRIVPFCSVGRAEGLLEAYFIKKIKIYGRIEDLIIEPALVGISKEKVSAGNNYQVILHPKLLEYQEEGK